MKDDLSIEELHYKDNIIDLKLGGENAQLFMVSLIEFFKQNGATNFLTLTLNDDTNKYEITIKNCNGIKTPAEELETLKTENKRLDKLSQELIEIIKQLEKVD